MASWKSTGTYVDEVPPPQANIVSGMWIFRVKRPSGSPPVFNARYVARGFSQRQGVDFFQTFSPTPKMTTLQVLLHVAAQRDYELHSLDFSTPFLQGSLHDEIWLRRPPGFTVSFPAGTQSTVSAKHLSELQKRHTCTDLGELASLQALYMAPSRHRKVQWDAAKRVLSYLCSTSAMGLVLGGRARVVLTGHADASWVDDLATLWSSQGYTFSLGSGSVSWRAFCRAEGIRPTFMLLASPQQNGIAECRIGMVMDVAQTTPTLRCTGKVGNASAFRVWGSRAFVRNTSADKLCSGAVPCVFLGFPPEAPGWQFYHPTLRRVQSTQDITFDESVYYCHPAEPVQVAVDSGAARGAEPAGARTGGAELGGAEPERVEPGSADSSVRTGGTGAAGAGAAGGAAGAGSAGGAAGAGATGGAASAGAARATGGAASAGATGGTAGAGATGGAARGATGLTERHEPESRPVLPVSRAASPVRTARAGCVLRPRPPLVPRTHSMTLRPSTAPQRVPLPSPPASSLLESPDPESDSLRAAFPAVTRFLATAVIDPLFESK
ncbi:unnamed protein product [Closterium sp. NIES-53]